MTTFDSTRIQTSGNVISNIIGTVAAWNDARQTRKILTSLTSRELEDIGLTYADIDGIAARGSRF